MRIAILSGDIIASSSLTTAQRKELEDLLWKELERISGSKDDFSIQRGDAFQMKITQPGRALKAAIELRCLLKSQLQQSGKAISDARISLGIGTEELKGRNVSSSDGEAYRLSGQGLDQLKEANTNLSIHTGEVIVDRSWEVISYLIDEHITEWSPMQAEAILLRLQGLTYEEMANKLGINTSAAFKRIESAHWKAVKKALDYFELAMK